MTHTRGTATGRVDTARSFQLVRDPGHRRLDAGGGVMSSHPKLNGGVTVKTILDLAISCCLTAMLFSPQIAEAAHNDGDCRPEGPCETRYKVVIGTNGVKEDCDVLGRYQGQVFSICNGCNETPCPNTGACECEVDGQPNTYYGRGDGCAQRG